MEHPKAKPRWGALRGRLATATGQLLIILVGVVTALAADRWNQGRLDHATAGDYLASLAKDLRVDTASLSAELGLPQTRAVEARLILGIVVEKEAVDCEENSPTAITSLRGDHSRTPQRQRVWGDDLTLSVDAVPSDLQEWAYRVDGQRTSGRTAPPSMVRASRP